MFLWRVFSVKNMFNRLIALFIVLAFASQVLAGGFACGTDKHNSPAEMACCAQAKSGTASPAAMICCETVCGESPNGTPGTHSDATVRPSVSAAPVALHPVAAINQLIASTVRPSTRPADALLLHYDPPALYLQNSAFLI